VVVEEADPASAIRLPQYAATFGVEALKRLDFIVDGKGGWAYVQPKKTPVRPHFLSKIGLCSSSRPAPEERRPRHTRAGWQFAL